MCKGILICVKIFFKNNYVYVIDKNQFVCVCIYEGLEN